MLPGSEVRDVSTAPARSAPLDSGTWFIAGLADRGRVNEPVLVRSLTQAVNEFGEFVAYGLLYNALDTFFHEGGAMAQVIRVVGPDAKTAFVLLKEEAKECLKVVALSPGGWANNVDIVVAEGSEEDTITLAVKENGVVKEQSLDLADKTAAIAWAEGSNYVRIEDAGVGVMPGVGTFELKEGDDDRENITDEEWQAALDLLSKDLGPGQVSLPGRTTEGAHEMLLEHAKSHSRVAILDLPDTGDSATLKASTAAVRDLDGAGYGGAFAPWAVVPGLTRGTTRTVPWSCVQAGMLARNDAAGLSPNKPAAGRNGEAKWVLELSQLPWDDATREDLNESGVNVVKTVVGNIRTYGNRTLVDPEDDPQLELFSNARLHMVITSRCEAKAEEFVFEEIDGKGHTFSRLNGELRGIIGPYYSAGSLFGETPDEAFFVDTGPQVNTPQTIQEKQINAAVEVRYSPAGERVRIDISRTLVTEAL